MSTYFCLFNFLNGKNTIQILIIGYAVVQNNPNSHLLKGGLKLFGSINCKSYKVWQN